MYCHCIKWATKDILLAAVYELKHAFICLLQNNAQHSLTHWRNVVWDRKAKAFAEAFVIQTIEYFDTELGFSATNMRKSTIVPVFLFYHGNKVLITKSLMSFLYKTCRERCSLLNNCDFKKADDWISFERNCFFLLI